MGSFLYVMKDNLNFYHLKIKILHKVIQKKKTIFLRVLIVLFDTLLFKIFALQNPIAGSLRIVVGK